MKRLETPRKNVNWDHSMIQGDTEPPITATLFAGEETEEDLTGDSVKFQMAKAGASTPKVDSAAIISNASSGTVYYNWDQSDTDEPGYYNAQWAVDNGSTGTYDETFPGDEYIIIRIVEDVA